MTILHIDETFHPLYGYHTAPLAKAEAKAGNKVYIITASWDMLYPVYHQFGDSANGSPALDLEYEKNYGIKIVRVNVKRYISNRAVYTRDIFKLINDINPDIIYVHLVESLIAIQLLLRKKKYPMIFDSHMLTMASKNKLSTVYNRCYRSFITPVIRRHNYYVIRTQDDFYVNNVLGIPESQTPFISFGTDTDIFKPSPEARTTFLLKHGLSDESFIVVYTGKLNDDKGGILLAKTAQKKFNTVGKPVVFLIVGNSVGDYGIDVDKEFEQSENTVIRYPLQKYMDLPQFYQCADVCVFPKQCSLSFYDAQACGLPVISENNNININRCSHGNGWTFTAGDVDDFRNKIEIAAKTVSDEYQKYKENAVRYIMSAYDYDSIASRYTEIFNNTIKQQN